MPDGTLTCPACGAAVAAGDRFCNVCGAPVPVAPTPPPMGLTCPTCGAALEPGARFCGGCGAPVAGALAGQPAAVPPPPPPAYRPLMAGAGGPAMPYAPVPAKKSDHTCLIVGIVAVVIVLLLVCCGFGAWALGSGLVESSSLPRQLALWIATAASRA